MLERISKKHTERTVIVAHEGLREVKGFTQLPNVILKHGALSFGAKVAFGVLLSYAWQEDFCWPAQERLAEDLGCSERQVRRLLVELKDGGLLEWKQQGLNRPNLYILIPDGRLPGMQKPLKHKDRTDLSAPERTDVTVQDRTNMSAKEYPKKNTHYVNVGALSSKKTGRHSSLPAEQVSYLVSELARACDDRKDISARTFAKIVRAFGEEGTFELISLTNEAARDGLITQGRKGAYLVGVAKKRAEANGFVIDFKPPSRQAA